MIESALALIAACLPLVYGFIWNQWLEHVVQNFRGLASRQLSHRQSDPTDTRTSKSRSGSTDSHSRMMPNVAGSTRIETSVESFDMHDILKKLSEELRPVGIALESSNTEGQHIV